MARFITGSTLVLLGLAGGYFFKTYHTTPYVISVLLINILLLTGTILLAGKKVGVGLWLILLGFELNDSTWSLVNMLRVLIPTLIGLVLALFDTVRREANQS